MMKNEELNLDKNIINIILNIMNLKKQFIINLILNNYLVYSLMIIFKYFYFFIKIFLIFI